VHRQACGMCVGSMAGPSGRLRDGAPLLPDGPAKQSCQHTTPISAGPARLCWARRINAIRAPRSPVPNSRAVRPHSNGLRTWDHMDHGSHGRSTWGHRFRFSTWWFSTWRAILHTSVSVLLGQHCVWPLRAVRSREHCRTLGADTHSLRKGWRSGKCMCTLACQPFCGTALGQPEAMAEQTKPTRGGSLQCLILPKAAAAHGAGPHGHNTV
jgi:hypothetical protein